MKSITEFPQHVLTKVLAAKKSLMAEGKSPEEVSQAVGETFKYEGDKLKHALAAADLVADTPSFRRVVVVAFGEEETAPAKYKKVEDNHYLVETMTLSTPAAASEKGDRKGGRKGGRDGGTGKSPWGATPEEIAAKKAGAKAKK